MVDGGLSDPFDVTTGVLQGDVLAPFLFVVLVDYLLKKATSQLDSRVVTHPRRSRRHPAKSLNDLDFADDIALLESSISRAQAQLTKTAEAAADLGLVISAPKTEYMTVNCNPQSALQVYGDPINHVSDFRYLGSMVACGSSDLKRRKSLAWCAFWKLEQLWKSPHISITTKVKLFNTTCVTILLYGCETWVISQDMENKINAFATSCYRVMLNIKHIDHVLNTTVYSMTNTVPLIHLVRHRQLKFLGHILRMSKEEPARRYALCIPTTGKRRPGRPRTSYLNYVQRLLGDNEGAMQEQQIAAFADDRRAWRNLVVACSAADGWWWWVRTETESFTWRSSFQVWSSFIVQTSWYFHLLSSVQNCLRPNPPEPQLLCPGSLFLPYVLVPEIISFYPYASTLLNYIPEEIAQCKSLSFFMKAVHLILCNQCLLHLVLFGPVQFAIFLVAF